MLVGWQRGYNFLASRTWEGNKIPFLSYLLNLSGGKMKLIKTSNLKEIEWLEKENHTHKGIEGDLKIFEVEEDVVIPNFEKIKIEKKIEIPKESNQEVTPNGKVIRDKKIKKEVKGKTKKKKK